MQLGTMSDVPQRLGGARKGGRKNTLINTVFPVTVRSWWNTTSAGQRELQLSLTTVRTEGRAPQRAIAAAHACIDAPAMEQERAWGVSLSVQNNELACGGGTWNTSDESDSER